MVGLRDEAVDGGLEIDHTSEDTAPEGTAAWRVLAKNPSTALSHEHEVGVKWKAKRGCRLAQAIDAPSGCLWTA